MYLFLLPRPELHVLSVAIPKEVGSALARDLKSRIAASSVGTSFVRRQLSCQGRSLLPFVAPKLANRGRGVSSQLRPSFAEPAECVKWPPPADAAAAEALFVSSVHAGTKSVLPRAAAERLVSVMRVMMLIMSMM